MEVFTILSKNKYQVIVTAKQPFGVEVWCRSYFGENCVIKRCKGRSFGWTLQPLTHFRVNTSAINIGEFYSSSSFICIVFFLSLIMAEVFTRKCWRFHLFIPQFSPEITFIPWQTTIKIYINKKQPSACFLFLSPWLWSVPIESTSLRSG